MLSTCRVVRLPRLLRRSWASWSGRAAPALDAIGGRNGGRVNVAERGYSKFRRAAMTNSTQTQQRPAQPEQPSTQARQPNQFDVQGDGVTISYSTSSIRGVPLFNYQDNERTFNRSGDEIRTEETAIATLVTIDLEQIPRCGRGHRNFVPAEDCLARGEHRNRARDHWHANDFCAPHRGADADLPGPEPFRDGSPGQILIPRTGASELAITRGAADADCVGSG